MIAQHNHSYAEGAAVPPARPIRFENNALAKLPPTIAWDGDDRGCIVLLDQTRVPAEIGLRRCETVEDLWHAIKVLAVRGAPAIGVAGALGLCLGTRDARDRGLAKFHAETQRVADYLIGCRPTAVNLAWAVRRVQRAGERGPSDEPRDRWHAMFIEAHAILLEDVAACRAIGELGAPLIPLDGGVLTHCNAGALATVAYGTALAPLYIAHEQGIRFTAYADETRPLLQGARLTAFELAAAGIDVRILCDNAAAQLLGSGRVQLVIVGADRIAANGDTANKIGTLSLAIAARHFNVPFYVAAPLSTFDPQLASGDRIPIEQRDASEVRGGYLRDGVAADVRCENPAFDVTPASLITGIVTPRGIITPVTRETIAATFT